MLENKTIKVLRTFRARIERELQKKTSWGRNELTNTITVVYFKLLEDLVEGKELENAE